MAYNPNALCLSPDITPGTPYPVAAIVPVGAFSGIDVTGATATTASAFLNAVQAADELGIALDITGATILLNQTVTIPQGTNLRLLANGKATINVNAASMTTTSDQGVTAATAFIIQTGGTNPASLTGTLSIIGDIEFVNVTGTSAMTRLISASCCLDRVFLIGGKTTGFSVMGNVGFVSTTDGVVNVPFTGTISSGTPNQITGASTTLGMLNGDVVTGPGIPSNTTITGISGSTITLSANGTTFGSSLSFNCACPVAAMTSNVTVNAGLMRDWTVVSDTNATGQCPKAIHWENVKDAFDDHIQVKGLGDGYLTRKVGGATTTIYVVGTARWSHCELETAVVTSEYNQAAKVKNVIFSDNWADVFAAPTPNSMIDMWGCWGANIDNNTAYGGGMLFFGTDSSFPNTGGDYYALGGRGLAATSNRNFNPTFQTCMFLGGAGVLGQPSAGVAYSVCGNVALNLESNPAFSVNPQTQCSFVDSFLISDLSIKSNAVHNLYNFWSTFSDGGVTIDGNSLNGTTHVMLNGGSTTFYACGVNYFFGSSQAARFELDNVVVNSGLPPAGIPLVSTETVFASFPWSSGPLTFNSPITGAHGIVAYWRLTLATTSGGTNFAIGKYEIFEVQGSATVNPLTANGNVTVSVTGGKVVLTNVGVNIGITATLERVF